MPKQKDAVKYIQSLLKARRIEFEAGFLDILEQPCIVIEIGSKSIAVDPGSGIWTGEQGKWRCIESSCTVSGALQAIEFLIEDQ